MGVMFDLPSRADVRKCVITRETIEKGIDPTLVTEAAETVARDVDAESAEPAGEQAAGSIATLPLLPTHELIRLPADGRAALRRAPEVRQSHRARLRGQDGHHPLLAA